MVRYIALLGLTLAVWGCNSEATDTNDNEMPNDPGVTEPGTQASHLVVHVEGRSAAGQNQALSDVSIYVLPYVAPTTDHQPQFGHDLPTVDPLGTTDQNGDARLEIEANTKLVVRVATDGFDDLIRIVEAPQNGESQLWLTMLETQRQTVTIPTEGSVDVKLGNTQGGTSDMVTLTIEAGDLGLQNGAGAAISGDIEVRFRSWDPAVDDPTTMPSDLRTAAADLTSYGMFRVEFFQNGERLNVRADQTIAWAMQVNETHQGMAEMAVEYDALNVYSLDNSTGLWIEDSNITKNYDSATGIMNTEATHFSTKNLDQPAPFPGRNCVEVQVVNQNGQSIPASIAIAGYGAGRLGCNQFACDFNNRAGDALTFNVTARAQLGGVWVEGSGSGAGECDDETGNVGCGLGGCADVRIELCPPEGAACDTREDCCNGLGCIEGVCQPCIQEAQTCADSNGCCGGLDCTDYQCFAP